MTPTTKEIKPPYGWMIVTDIDAKAEDRYFPQLCAYCRRIDPGPGFRLLAEDDAWTGQFSVTTDGSTWLDMNHYWTDNARRYLERFPSTLAIRVHVATPEPANAPCGNFPVRQPSVWHEVGDLAGLPAADLPVVVIYRDQLNGQRGNLASWVVLAGNVRAGDPRMTHWTHPPQEKTREELDREAFKAWSRSQTVCRNHEQAYLAGVAQGRAEAGK